MLISLEIQNLRNAKKNSSTSPPLPLSTEEADEVQDGHQSPFQERKRGWASGSQGEAWLLGGGKVWAEADDSTARGRFTFMIFPIPFKPVEL